MINFRFKNILTGMLVVIIIGCSTLGHRTVSISEDEIQTRLAEKLSLPITLLKVFDVQLSNPLVKLDAASNRLYTKMDAELKNPLGKSIKGQAQISGLPRFDAATLSIVLSEVKIESLYLQGLDSKYNELFTALTKQLGNAVLQEIPLYTLKADDLKRGNSHYLPTEFKVVNNKLQVTLVPQ